MCPSRSIGQIGDGHDAPGPNPNQKFARDAIATTVFLGSFASHVAPAQHGRPSSYFSAVIAQCGDAVNGDKGKWRAFVVDADGPRGSRRRPFPFMVSSPVVKTMSPGGSMGARVCGDPTTPPVQLRAWPRSAW